VLLAYRLNDRRGFAYRTGHCCLRVPCHRLELNAGAAWALFRRASTLSHSDTAAGECPEMEQSQDLFSSSIIAIAAVGLSALKPLIT
jgi:hypothetical protein